MPAAGPHLPLPAPGRHARGAPAARSAWTWWKAGETVEQTGLRYLQYHTYSVFKYYCFGLVLVSTPLAEALLAPPSTDPGGGGKPEGMQR